MTPQEQERARNELLLKLGKDRELAHAVLFQKRHPDATPEFHRDMMRLCGSSAPYVLILALREGAKSTVAEEEIILDALYQRFHNAVIVGETSDRANDRLRAIKHELEYNEWITYLFGGMKGATWNEDKIVLQNNVCIQAKGRDQSFRGTKHIEWRPDYLLLDDYEDKESVKTPDSRDYWTRVFMAVILPALNKDHRVRVLGTPLDEDCMLYRLRKEKKLDGTPKWITREYPIEYIDKDGNRTPIWPARYPLEHIDALKQSYAEQGMMEDYMREYMVQAANPELKKFTDDMLVVKPHLRTWQPTIAIYDPARTAKAETSSMYGSVVASWIGNKIVVWEAQGRFLMPNQMIDDMFRVEEEYHPIQIGVEQTGLNEWVLQPVRHEQTKRRIILPLVALDAPKGKLEFIGALQPFFKAHEIEFATELPELRRQLLAFPTGRLDVPNALAYMLKMRPGAPVFDGFNHQNVVAELAGATRRPFFLALNADLGLVTAALCQHIDGAMWVLADWVREGDPGDVLRDIVRDAALAFKTTPQLVCGQVHLKQFDTIGLMAAARKIVHEVRTGGDQTQGREELRRLLQTMRRGEPALLVARDATWTSRAFAGGYAREIQRGGLLSTEPVKNAYRVLMEGLEALAGLLPQNANEAMDAAPHYALNERGVRYITAMPQHGQPQAAFSAKR